MVMQAENVAKKALLQYFSTMMVYWAHFCPKYLQQYLLVLTRKFRQLSKGGEEHGAYHHYRAILCVTFHFLNVALCNMYKFLW